MAFMQTLKRLPEGSLDPRGDLDELVFDAEMT